MGFQSKFAAFKSRNQIAHPLDIEDLLEYGVDLYRPDLPLLETVSVPEGHPAKRYLEHRSHDAAIHWLSVVSQGVSLSINDYDGWRLAGAYEERLGMPITRSMRIPFIPVSLVFSQLREFRVYQYEADGRLVRLKHSLRSNLAKMDSFIHDTVFQFDEDGVSLIIEASLHPARHSLICPAESGRPHGTGSVWHAHDLLLCIDCQDIQVEERQREAWQAHFGEERLWVWDAYLKVRDERAMPGWQDFVDYLEEIGA